MQCLFYETSTWHLYGDFKNRNGIELFWIIFIFFSGACSLHLPVELPVTMSTFAGTNWFPFKHKMYCCFTDLTDFGFGLSIRAMDSSTFMVVRNPITWATSIGLMGLSRRLWRGRITGSSWIQILGNGRQTILTLREVWYVSSVSARPCCLLFSYRIVLAIGNSW